MKRDLTFQLRLAFMEFCTSWSRFWRAFGLDARIPQEVGFHPMAASAGAGLACPRSVTISNDGYVFTWGSISIRKPP